MMMSPLGQTINAVRKYNKAQGRGSEAYPNDLPHAEMHRLQSVHFAVEDSLEQIAAGIHRFFTTRKVKNQREAPSR
jgi:hypothetical protein